ncbi:tryptophan-rich sensory protein [Labilibacter sediminis]|nr:tryptophan-rich sensory protein [Labilibacter sediminis]
MIKRTILFLILNFSALAIAGRFTATGVPSEWYLNLEKAPWTPPGWMFGTAWTFIMICFAIYMAYLIVLNSQRKKVITLFAIQWILNVAWSPLFFYYKTTFTALITISLLTAVVTYFLIKHKDTLKFKSIFIAPYVIWLILATSLNAYVVLFN